MKVMKLSYGEAILVYMATVFFRKSHTEECKAVVYSAGGEREYCFTIARGTPPGSVCGGLSEPGAYYLATPHLQSDRDKLINVTGLENAGYWVGLRYQNANNTWLWNDGTVFSPATWPNFRYDAHKPEIDCAFLRNRTLFTSKCDNDRHALCKRDLVEESSTITYTFTTQEELDTEVTTETTDQTTMLGHTTQMSDHTTSTTAPTIKVTNKPTAPVTSENTKSTFKPTAPITSENTRMTDEPTFSVSPEYSKITDEQTAPTNTMTTKITSQPVVKETLHTEQNVDQTTLSTTTARPASRPCKMPVLTSMRPGTRVSEASIDSYSVLVVTCDLDFRLSDGTSVRTIFCHNDGHWTFPVPECQALKCAYIPEPLNSIRSSGSTELGVRVNYTCLNGMMMSDGVKQKTITCSSGHWSDDVTDCQVRRCSAVPFILNARLNTTSSDVGSVVRITCLDGYVFPGNKTNQMLTCGANREWRPKIGHCRPDLCRAHIKVENAFTSFSKLLDVLFVKYTCRTGYRFKDGNFSKIFSCNDRIQQGSIECEVMSCETPLILENTELDFTALTYGSVASVTCVTGRQFPDGRFSIKITCSLKSRESDLEWIPDVPECQTVHCLEPPNVEFAVKESNSTEYNQTATYTCSERFEFKGKGQTDVVRCTSHAKWDHDILPCTAVECSPLPTWADMTFNTSNRSQGTVVAYRCRDGFEFENETLTKVSTCSATRAWTPPISKCIVSKWKNIEQDPPAESQNAVPIGAFVLSIMAVLVSCIILLDANKLRHDLVVMATRFSSSAQSARMRQTSKRRKQRSRKIRRNPKHNLNRVSDFHAADVQLLEMKSSLTEGAHELE